MDADDEGLRNGLQVYVYDDALPPERKGYRPRRPPSINYNSKRANLRYMGWNNLIVGTSPLNNFSEGELNDINVITTFV